MNNTLKNILIVIGGLVVGNLGIFAVMYIGNSMVSWPEGVDPNNIESIKANLHLFKPHNFILPFASHAVGTFLAAFFAGMIPSSNPYKLAMIVGLFFLVAGIINIFLLKHPLWFICVDLIFAYLPMAYLGYLLAKKLS